MLVYITIALISYQYQLYTKKTEKFMQLFCSLFYQYLLFKVNIYKLCYIIIKRLDVII